MKQINEPIGEFTLEYEDWKIYKKSDNKYEYWHSPYPIMGECHYYKVSVEYDEERKWYNFEAEEYMEIYGSGGWSRWVNYTNELKDIIMDDVMRRVGK
jgi:hypothetical protein